MNINKLEMNLLNKVNDLTSVPKGAVNIRRDGEAVIRQSSPNVSIKTKTNNSGLTVEVKPATKNETIHVPVLLTKAGFTDKVNNTFIIGEYADITIIAGCGIHNDSHFHSRHDGVHEIIVKEGARLKYVEKHYGEGNGEGKRTLNPQAVITIEKGAGVEMISSQIKGVDDTERIVTAHVHEKANLKVVERLMTQYEQSAASEIVVFIEGKGASAQILSRSVAQGRSYQSFRAALIGKTACTGHLECDAIIMDEARIKSVPELLAEDADAVLTHEAAIGKIAGEQLIKLMSLGLSEKEALDTILNGFLR